MELVVAGVKTFERVEKRSICRREIRNGSIYNYVVYGVQTKYRLFAYNSIFSRNTKAQS